MTIENARMGRSNPWANLPSNAPYVLPQDMAILRGYPDLLREGHPRKLRFELVPAPFVGNPRTARVILLSLNPGFGERDQSDEGREPLATWVRHSLLLRPGAIFHPLSPSLSAASGSQWWHKHLARVEGLVPADSLMNHLANVEWFPYHSKRFQSIGTTLPSQEFTFETVDEAVRRGGIVIVTRSTALWRASVPALDLPTVITLKNPQNPVISPGNMGKDDFERVVEALR
jgi:hypothetical protein